MKQTPWEPFYKGKRIFVTGHTGFKGSWLLQWLLNLNVEVTGYSVDIPTNPSLYSVLRLAKQIHDVRGDICHMDRLKQSLRICDPVVIFHLAAQAIVSVSYQEPFATFQTNTLGTITLLEAIRQLKKENYLQSLRSVVIVTSDKCYENKNWFEGYREQDPMGGADPYSASKGATEIAVKSYYHSFFQSLDVGLATARAGNVIGGGDWAIDRLIPDLVKAFESSCELVLRKPLSIRPWQHVLEPLSGYLLLGKLLAQEASSYSEGWNFGPGNTKMFTVQELVELALSHWPNHSYRIEPDLNFTETNLLQLDIHKAIAKLHWLPRWSVEKAVEKTLQWYKAYTDASQEYLIKMTQEQIMEYSRS